MLTGAMQFDKPLCLAFALSTLAASAQNSGVTTNTHSPAKIRPVSLRQCLQSALERNLDIQIARRTPTAAGYTLKAAIGFYYDPVFSFGANERSDTLPPVVDFDKQNIHLPNTIESVNLDAGLNGNLTPGLSYRLGGTSSEVTGTTEMLTPVGNPTHPTVPPFYTVNGIVYGLDSTVIPNPRPGQYYQSIFGLHLRQSLLRDFWIDAGRMHIQMDRKSLKISQQALLLQVMSTVLAVQQAYYELIYANENVKVMQKALEVAQELLDGDRQRVAAGTLPPLSESLSESLVETARANLLAAQELLEVRANALRILLTDDFANAPEEMLLPQDILVTVWESPNRSVSFQKALEKRPEVIQARLELERQGILVRYAHNQTFPTVDVVGSVGGNGVNDTSRSTTVDDIFDGKPSWSVGVILRVPLSNTEARNKYKASKEFQQQALLSLKKMEQTVFVQVDDVIKTLENVFKRVGATRQARLYAQLALDAERQKRAEGTSTTFLVSEYERRVVMARTAEILAVVDYSKAVAQLDFNEGGTLERNQIMVDFK